MPLRKGIIYAAVPAIATDCGLSHRRIRGIIKDLGLKPDGYIGKSPLYSATKRKLIAGRNTKPGPKGTSNARKRR